MILYKLEPNGECTNLQYAEASKEGYLSIEGDRLPKIETLHTSAYKATLAQEELREKRNALLASSDWTGLVDSALTSEVSAKWKLYRQRLRDLPSGLNTPAKVKAVKWPTKPA